MPHSHHRASVTAIIAMLAAALLVPGSAAAQKAGPISASWDALPGVMADNARVVVKTRDGHTTKGRLRGLSDTAIVVESGQVRTIPAADVVSIEERLGRRPVMRGMKVGLYGGLTMFGFYLWAAAPYLIHSVPCAPADEDCITGSDVLYAAFALPALGAAVGAGLGALAPGQRTLVYKAGADAALGIAPIAGKGRRGIALRVAF